MSSSALTAFFVGISAFVSFSAFAASISAASAASSSASTSAAGSAAASTSSRLSVISAVSGSAVVFSCDSSFPPPWAKVGPRPGDYKTLALNGRRHPNFLDERFAFSSRGSTYDLTVGRVEAADAGRYVCDGQSSVAYLLNVVRYIYGD